MNKSKEHSQACKSLYDASKVRSVWLEVTYLMMEEQEILPNTYPLEALDTTTLRHIATSPARFSSLLKNHRDSRLLPKSSRILLGPIEEATRLGMRVHPEVRHFPTLLPGGRFLFLLWEGSVTGAGSRHKACVQLWDLGLPGTSSQSTLTASSILEDIYISWQVLPDPISSVYHLVVQNDQGIDIYAFDTGSPFHFAKPTNRLAPDGDILDFSWWKNRIAWVTDRCQVVIWDFKKRSATSWVVDPYFLVEEVRMLVRQLLD
ncbi:hypothetical protein CPB83DRAFT_283432 [Crepidotus variabilis]|uniref:Uncharacterized protein n=1 Tax=Crepidotus variabilis TaxID=179855 RepID=A0A9P6EHK1_9AGAR|nr:hypothetical protein CPB83DRAFT_283432 [Crepidotus variabilis]